MDLTFEWDEEKSQINFKKHDIGFEEAKTVFGDPWAITIQDPLHSESEERFMTIGISSKDRIIVVIHTERHSNIRIISSRKAARSERKTYEKNR